MITKVPRGTSTPKVRRIALSSWQRKALAAGDLHELRSPVCSENSTVYPGSFEGLDLESGRARRGLGLVELRARCRFESGAVRAVTVRPVDAVGDLRWVHAGDPQGRRALSKFTLEITGLELGRLRDMTRIQALRTGIDHALQLDTITEDGWFQRAWDKDHAPAHRWAANPWVWVERVRVHSKNIDEVLKTWKGRAP